MSNSYRKFYLTSVTAVLAASYYPIYMGIKTLINAWQKGFVLTEEYPKYIIPYTPISISLIAVVCLMPLLFRFCKKRTLLFSSGIGVVLFGISEYLFEQIPVVEGYTTLPLESWQYSLCSITPQVLQTIGEPIYAENNPAYKIHFYLISLIIILTVVNVVSGFTSMLKEQSYGKKKPLIAQLISVLLFIGLCIFACFTAFYRKGTIQVSGISAVLMSTFFIVFGVTFGVYFGCIFYRKNKWFSVIIPAIASTITTAVMYAGELILMGGKLFSFGNGVLFNTLGSLPFAGIDFAVIIISGLITYGLMLLLNRKQAVISIIKS